MYLHCINEHGTDAPGLQIPHNSLSPVFKFRPTTVHASWKLTEEEIRARVFLSFRIVVINKQAIDGCS
ncbi:hypothetical protein NC651_013928 [Populus alba x Populus x berolinensis]|nr:hypothetical protein NC651_013928 [Populus alba x Populus x berolinensis]